MGAKDASLIRRRTIRKRPAKWRTKWGRMANLVAVPGDLLASEMPIANHVRMSVCRHALLNYPMIDGVCHP